MILLAIACIKRFCLMRGINRDLTVIARDETTAAWHDATIAIGEVTLRPVWRRSGLLFVGSKVLA